MAYKLHKNCKTFNPIEYDHNFEELSDKQTYSNFCDKQFDSFKRDDDYEGAYHIPEYDHNSDFEIEHKIKKLNIYNREKYNCKFKIRYQCIDS
ncbi:hypothetical protein POVCU1_082940 [Plasmodium ovale curtisi]|uniref:Uncharacterized protein n=1 Tax=Plasmodium ovale curtisi TaxID=864141 RepID=A0A1A8XGD3_PLAOA|nr:hypothetical protein POVCU1_082940 [Plasmodium ovale curtisi]